MDTVDVICREYTRKIMDKIKELNDLHINLLESSDSRESRDSARSDDSARSEESTDDSGKSEESTDDSARSEESTDDSGKSEESINSANLENYDSYISDKSGELHDSLESIDHSGSEMYTQLTELINTTFSPSSNPYDLNYMAIPTVPVNSNERSIDQTKSVVPILSESLVTVPISSERLPSVPVNSQKRSVNHSIDRKKSIDSVNNRKKSVDREECRCDKNRRRESRNGQESPSIKRVIRNRRKVTRYKPVSDQSQMFIRRMKT